MSGLSVAQRLVLTPASPSPTPHIQVLEQQHRVGGNVTSCSSEGFTWEEGPTSFAPNSFLLRSLVDAGLQSDLVLADRKLPRFVYWQQQMQPVPMSPLALFSTRLLSDGAKLRAALGAAGFVMPMMGNVPGGEETVQQFFTRHLGAEVVERLVAPFISGVYAGDPTQLSAAAALGRIVALERAGGGLVAGAILSRLKSGKATVDPSLPKTRPGELGSFKQGLGTLPNSIAAALGDRVQLGCRVMRIERSAEHEYSVHLEGPNGPQMLRTRTLVLTSPADVAAQLLDPFSAEAGAALRAIPYPPVACVVLAYPQSHLRQPLVGFGNLIPRNQGVRTLGSIWSSSLFPGRAPQGWQLLTNFIGGATDEAIAHLSKEAIVAEVDRDLRTMVLKPDAPAPKVLAVHLWRRAIPQYTLGHHQRLDTVRHALDKLPGLYLCSNYLDGVSLGDCVRRGQDTANQIVQHLATIGATA